MYLERDRKNSQLSLIDKDEVLLSMSWFFDEFIWMINGINPIEITRDVDEILFNNLCNLLSNEYEFYTSNKLSNQRENRIEWLSDQAVDLEDDFATDAINRLIIEKVEDKIIITVLNPFCNKNGIIRRSYTVAFSPSGNGYMTKNVKSGMSFQDDIVSLFAHTMDGVNVIDVKEPQKKLK